MIEKREPLRTILKFLTFCGFSDEISSRHKKIALLAFIMFCVGYTLGSTLSLLQARSIEEVSEAIMLTPTLYTAIVCFTNIYIKRTKLRKLFEILNEIESADPAFSEYLDKACKMSSILFKITAVAVVICCTVSSVLPAIVGTLMIKLYIPEMCNSRLGFYIMWAYGTPCCFYCGLVFITVHELSCLSLVVEGYSVKYLRSLLQNLNANRENYVEAKENLKKCVKVHRDIKRSPIQRLIN
jgi:7tm Odorant receptor